VAALQRALGLRIGRLEDQPANRQLAVEAGEHVGRASAAGVDRALAIPDQRLRQRAKPAQTAAHPQQHVGRLLGEHQRAGDRARVAKLRGHHPAAARLAIAHRDLTARLEQVELQQLARPIDGALIGALGRKQRPHLTHVVVEDCLRAVEADLAQQLAHALAGNARILAQQPVNLVLERVELRGAPCPAIPRRALAPQRTTNGVAVMPGALGDLADREPIDLPHPPDLRPAPHVEHPFLLASIKAD
jgi:hypothetical protein